MNTKEHSDDTRECVVAISNASDNIDTTRYALIVEEPRLIIRILLIAKRFEDWLQNLFRW